VRFKRTEYLGDLTSSLDWELTQFKVNPGLPDVFPWLSTIASGFQKYRIDGLIFYLKSTSANGIANMANLNLGTVLGGFQYDPYAGPPASKAEFLALSGSCTDKPSDDQIFPMECDPRKNVFGNLLVRTTGVSSDLVKYDHATFNLATVGSQGTYPVGELWVAYDVMLMAPKTAEPDGYLRTVDSTGLFMLSDPFYEHTLVCCGGNDSNYANTLGVKQVVTSQHGTAWELPVGADGIYRVSGVIGPTAAAPNGTISVSCPDDTGVVEDLAEVDEESGQTTDHTAGAIEVRFCYFVRVTPHLNTATRIHVTQQYQADPGTTVPFALTILKLPPDWETRGKAPSAKTFTRAPSMKVSRSAVTQSVHNAANATLGA